MMFLLCLLPLSYMALPSPSHHKVEVSLAPLLDTNSSFNRADLDGYINLFAQFPSFVPEPIKIIFDNLSSEIRDGIVLTVNKIEQGTLYIPNNFTAIMDYVNSKSPEFGERIQLAVDSLMDIIGGFSPATKRKFDKWFNRTLEAVSGDNAGRANRIARLIYDFKTAFDNADQVTRSDIQKNSPQAYNLLTSGFAARFATAAKMFANSGLTADIHKLSAYAYTDYMKNDVPEQTENN